MMVTVYSYTLFGINMDGNKRSSLKASLEKIRQIRGRRIEGTAEDVAVSDLDAYGFYHSRLNDDRDTPA